MKFKFQIQLKEKLYKIQIDYNRKIYDSNEKINCNINYEDYKKSKISTIGHFYQKLLLLKNYINTEKGKEIAFQRHKFMIKFLKQFYKENYEYQKISSF